MLGFSSLRSTDLFRVVLVNKRWISAHLTNLSIELHPQQVYGFELGVLSCKRWLEILALKSWDAGRHLVSRTGLPPSLAMLDRSLIYGED